MDLCEMDCALQNSQDQYEISTNSCLGKVAEDLQTVYRMFESKVVEEREIWLTSHMGREENKKDAKRGTSGRFCMWWVRVARVAQPIRAGYSCAAQLSPHHFSCTRATRLRNPMQPTAR